jgi:hypothetical protein
MTVFARDMSMTVMVPEQRSTCRPVAPRPGALLRHEMGRRPSSLFSLFFPKLSAADPPFSAEILDFCATTCRTNSGVLGCFPLLLMFIRDRWCFNGCRKRYRALAPARDMGACRSSRRESAGINHSIAILVPSFQISSYCYLSGRGTAERRKS